MGSNLPEHKAHLLLAAQPRRWRGREQTWGEEEAIGFYLQFHPCASSSSSPLWSPPPSCCEIITRAWWSCYWPPLERGSPSLKITSRVTGHFLAILQSLEQLWGVLICSGPGWLLLLLFHWEEFFERLSFPFSRNLGLQLNSNDQLFEGRLLHLAGWVIVVASPHRHDLQHRTHSLWLGGSSSGLVVVITGVRWSLTGWNYWRRLYCTHWTWTTLTNIQFLGTTWGSDIVFVRKST